MTTTKLETMLQFNGLLPSEAERLDMLAEECAEVIQIISKIKRHGYSSAHPDDMTTTNRQLLAREVAQAQAVLRLMTLAGDIGEETMEEDICDKFETMMKWTHHNAGLALYIVDHGLQLRSSGAAVPFFRANGDVCCLECGKPYIDHPYSTSPRDQFNGQPFLHVLCDGSLVKL